MHRWLRLLARGDAAPPAARVRSIVAVALAALLNVALALAQQRPAMHIYVPAASLSWHKECVAVAADSRPSQFANACYTYSSVIEEHGFTLFYFGLAESGSGNAKAMLIVLPCDAFGVRSYRIDNEFDRTAPAQICTAICCHQIIELAGDLVERMKNGKEITFTLDNHYQDVQITFPLAGLSAASEAPPSVPAHFDARNLNEYLAGWLKKRE
jgi:invasion protein IalB